MLSALRLTFAGLSAVAMLLGATGCTGLDEANAASITRDDLVSELAAQLADEATLTYTATYQLAGGDTARIARTQKPARVAYEFPGGRLIVTPTATIKCAGRGKPTTCTETDPASAASLTGTALTGTALTGTALTPTDPASHGPDNTDPASTDPASTALITPELALAMLNTAALDTKVTVDLHDTTIAGRHATCLNLQEVDGTAARAFNICVTSEGALGSFAATINGKPADVAMTNYADKADEELFVLPADAKLVDQRTATITK